MDNDRYNFEIDTNKIICPYCGYEYDLELEGTYISDEYVDIYEEGTEEYTCEKCKRKFKLEIFFEWTYRTETIFVD